MTAAFKRVMNVEALEVENEWVILNADQFTVTKLNEVGGICWSLMKESRTVQDLAEALCERYSITPDEAQADVEAFLADLQRLGLVENAS